MNNNFGSYLAGVADSDGSFSVVIRHRDRKNPSYIPCFQLTWTLTDKTKEVFDFIVNKYGGTYHYNKRIQTVYGTSNPTIKYFAQGKALDKLILDIDGHLILKCEQLNLIKLLRSTTFYQRNKPQELHDLHHQIYLDMKQLNSKNSGKRQIYANK